MNAQPGAAIKLSQFKLEACELLQSINRNKLVKLFSDTDFLAMGHNNYSWNVVRCI
jgi:hypothetical protein